MLHQKQNYTDNLMLCSLPRSSAVKEKCPLLSLHDKLTMNTQCWLQCSTYQKKALSLNVGFNPTSPYINEKEKCPLLSLQDKPTLTPKVFSNSLLQQLIIYSLERKTHIPASQQEKRVGFIFLTFLTTGSDLYQLFQ